MATRKTKAKKPPVQKPTMLRTVALAPEDAETLTQLVQEIADRLGRAPSRSAVFRSLLRLARDGAVIDRLVSFLEIELNAGVRWGKDSVKRWQRK